LDAERDQPLLRAVVQVPLDLRSFRILRFDEPAARRTGLVDREPELRGQTDVPNDQTGTTAATVVRGDRERAGQLRGGSLPP